MKRVWIAVAVAPMALALVSSGAPAAPATAIDASGAWDGALPAGQAKGFVTARWGLPGERGPSEGGGPRRKYFKLTASGRRRLAESEQLLIRPHPRPAATAEARQ